MNINKIHAMDLHIERIAHYSLYADILMRILTELIGDGGNNIQPSDIPNLAELLYKYVHRMRICIINMKTDWEFYT